MLYLAYIADESFQRATASALGHFAGGLCSASPKAWARVELKNATDYASADNPAIAMNRDFCRNCTTFKPAGGLVEGFAALEGRFGPALSVKNTYDHGFDAVKESNGYRCVIAVFRFAPKGVTWGELLHANEAGPLREKLNEIIWSQEIRRDETGEWQTSIAAGLASAVGNEGVSILVECQLLLDDYLQMRRKSHLPYKLVRNWGDNPVDTTLSRKETQGRVQRDFLHSTL